MEHLELEHVLPYLNHNVRVYLEYGNRPPKIDFITSIASLPDKMLTLMDNEDYYFGQDNEISLKPILKPLDNLLKDDEFTKMLKNELFEDLTFRLYETSGLVGIEINDQKTLILVDDEIADDCPLFIYKWLVKNHYDIFNLITFDLGYNVELLSNGR